MTLQTPFTRLQLGDVQLWSPPRVYSELVGFKNTYAAGVCGSALISTDLTYKIYISGFCSLREAQIIQGTIEAELRTAPKLTLIRQDSSDALAFSNFVQKGTLDLSNDLTDLRARFGGEVTLVLSLVLTILPAGTSGQGATAFRNLKVLAATGALDWAALSLGALLFRASSTAPEEPIAAHLDSFVDLDEVAGDSGGIYTRQAISGQGIVPTSAEVELYVADDTLFVIGALAGDGATGGIIYNDVGGSDATRQPLILVEFPAVDLSGGGTIRFAPDLLGVF